MSTQYIGAPAEDLILNKTASGAVQIPGTNEVRIHFTDGTTILYDYFFNLWGEFSGIGSLSTCIYQGLHTILTTTNLIMQETPGLYQDNSVPVLMSFTTSWLNLAGLQGLERAYFAYIIGQYLTPHKLQVSMSYDYNSSTTQSTIIQPDNYSAAYGSSSYYGADAAYGSLSLEQWRIFFQQQKCESIQITVQELFDSTYGSTNGAGLTISGLMLVYGAKKGHYTTGGKDVG